jgi:hypothetical protein
MPATANPNEYAVSLSARPVGNYEYYVRTIDAAALVTRVPATAPVELYTFRIDTLCPTELAYDDGSAEWYSYPVADSIGFQWAVKFGPVQTPFALFGARFAASRSIPDCTHTPVRVCVYAADGVGGLPGTLIKQLVAGSVGNVIGGLPATTNWAQVILQDNAGAPLLLDVPEFYVAVGEIQPLRTEAFGRDTSGVNAHRSYLYNPCDATWISEDITRSDTHVGNRLIRAQGYPLIAPIATIYRSGSTVNLNWGRTGAPAYHVYSAPVSGGPFAFVQSTTDTFFSVAGIDTSATLKLFYQVRSATP